MTTEALSAGTQAQERRRIKRPHTKVKTGCLTCRKRRVKCDEVRPACTQCAKRSLICEGYEHVRTWFFHSASSGNLHHSGDNITVVEDHNSKQAQLTRDDITSTGYVRSTIAWRSGLLDYLVVRWLPTNIPTIVPLGSWCLVAKDLSDASSHEVVTQAMLTFSVALMSILENDTRLQVGAIRGYQKVLGVLRSRIEGDRYRARLRCDYKFLASLAAAGFACAMIEYMLQTWLRSDQHLSGIEMMFRACGPSVLDDPVNRQIFFDHRIIWICCDFLHRKTSCYCTPEWQEFTWSRSDPIYSSPLHRLFTLASNVPPIMHKYDKVKHNATLKVHARHYLKFKQHLRLFDVWKTDSTSLGELNSPRALELPDRPFSKQITYSSSDTMMTHMYYSALKIFVLLEALDSAGRIQTCLNGEPDDVVGTDSARFLSSCEEEALNICQSARSLMSDQGGAVRMPCTVFLIDTAWQAWAALERSASYDLSAIRIWFSEIGEIVTKQGFQMMRQPWRIAGEDCPLTQNQID